MNNNTSKLSRSNLRRARCIWGNLSPQLVNSLRELTVRYGLSIGSGDLPALRGEVVRHTCWSVAYQHPASVLRNPRRSWKGGSPIQLLIDGSSKRWSTKPQDPEASSATEMLIPPTSLPWSAAPRCGLPKLAPSTAPCAKPTESASALSRNSAGLQDRPENCPTELESKPFNAGGNGHHSGSATAAPRPALPSDPPVQPRSDISSKLTPPTSAVPKRSKMPAGIWSNPSFPIWRPRPKKTVTA